MRSRCKNVTLLASSSFGIRAILLLMNDEIQKTYNNQFSSKYAHFVNTYLLNIFKLYIEEVHIHRELIKSYSGIECKKMIVQLVLCIQCVLQYCMVFCERAKVPLSTTIDSCDSSDSCDSNDSSNIKICHQIYIYIFIYFYVLKIVTKLKNSNCDKTQKLKW